MELSEDIYNRTIALPVAVRNCTHFRVHSQRDSQSTFEKSGS